MVRVWLAACLLLGAASCTPVPIATAYPVTLQPKMQAAQHWQLLAQNFAAQIASLPNPYRRPIYVAHKTPEAPFSEAFESFLKATLVGYGQVLVANPLGARVVDYSVQPVIHGALWDPYPSTSIPLDAAVLATDLVVGSAVLPTGAEVVITLAVSDQDAVPHQVLREAASFYVSAGDIRLYPDVRLRPVAFGPLLFAPPVSLRVVDP